MVDVHIKSFLEIIAGLGHSPLTVKKYEDCLLKSSRSLCASLRDKCCDQVTLENTEQYKNELLTKLDPVTADTDPVSIWSIEERPNEKGHL